MRRKISFIIGATLLMGALAIVLRSVPSPARWAAPAVNSVLSAVSSWLGVEPDPVVAEVDKPKVAASAQYTIGPEAASLPEIRVWAIRGGNVYGWVQLPKGTVVHLLREEGPWLIVRYDESVVKIHRTVAEAGLVVPVLRSGRLAAL